MDLTQQVVTSVKSDGFLPMDLYGAISNAIKVGDETPVNNLQKNIFA